VTFEIGNGKRLTVTEYSEADKKHIDQYHDVTTNDLFGGKIIQAKLSLTTNVKYIDGVKFVIESTRTQKILEHIDIHHLTGNFIQPAILDNFMIMRVRFFNGGDEEFEIKKIPGSNIKVNLKIRKITNKSFSFYAIIENQQLELLIFPNKHAYNKAIAYFGLSIDKNIMIFRNDDTKNIHLVYPYTGLEFIVNNGDMYHSGMMVVNNRPGFAGFIDNTHSMFILENPRTKALKLLYIISYLEDESGNRSILEPVYKQNIHWYAGKHAKLISYNNPGLTYVHIYGPVDKRKIAMISSTIEVYKYLPFSMERVSFPSLEAGFECYFLAQATCNYRLALLCFKTLIQTLSLSDVNNYEEYIIGSNPYNTIFDEAIKYTIKRKEFSKKSLLDEYLLRMLMCNNQIPIQYKLPSSFFNSGETISLMTQ